ncbi:MAG: DsbA family protein, partial [Myxococcota bacterium]|nr:DsbA family protein [Myxococcota bacterium]
LSATRDRGDLHLAIYPPDPGEDPHAIAWHRALWCAKEQDKTWSLLDAAAAATGHSHEHPVPGGQTHRDDDTNAHTLADTLRLAGVDAKTCVDRVRPPATFVGPAWLINGRRYDGSMGWGPPALRRLAPAKATTR